MSSFINSVSLSVIQVKLYKMVKHMPKEEVKLSDEVTFHPMIGFTIQYATAFYHGRLECHGTLNGTYSEEQVYILMYHKGKHTSRRQNRQNVNVRYIRMYHYVYNINK